METIHTTTELDQLLAENDAVLGYFSTASCSVCHVLKPKVYEMVKDSFPNLKMVFVESDKSPELAAQYRVFTAPTVVVFFAGRETIRKSRAFGVDELKQEIARPYSLMFEA
jgi:thioredoxin-like negative regulator of GroEL